MISIDPDEFVGPPSPGVHDFYNSWVDVFGDPTASIQQGKPPEPASLPPSYQPVVLVEQVDTAFIMRTLTEYYTRRNNTGIEGWCVFPELSARTSWSPSRIDLFVMAAWESLNYTRIAYEVKVSRSDFQREMRTPDKKAWALALSNQFYFACPKGMIGISELPPEAGLVYVHKDGKLQWVHRAPKREAPKGLTLQFASSLLRRAYRLMEERERGLENNVFNTKG